MLHNTATHSDKEIGSDAWRQEIETQMRNKITTEKNKLLGMSHEELMEYTATLTVGLAEQNAAFEEMVNTFKILQDDQMSCAGAINEIITAINKIIRREKLQPLQLLSFLKRRK